MNNTVLKRISEIEYSEAKHGDTVLCKISHDKYRKINKEWVESYEQYTEKRHIPDSQLPIKIVRQENDSVNISNINFLTEKYPQSILCFVKGDHIFKHPVDAFTVLVREIL